MAESSSSHYQVLRIAVTATEKEVKLAYRKAARLAHPDHGGDAAEFRRITQAYETLIDPARRRAYDRSYARGTAGRASGQGAEQDSGEAHFDAPAAGSHASATIHRPAASRNTAGDAPVYWPPYPEPGVPNAETPLIPWAEANRQIHGMPRKRGIFGAEARIQRELQTVQLIDRQVLSAIPAARLVNGLLSPADNSHIDHAVLSGYRLALVGSMLLPKGAYAWDGQTLNHGGRSVAPPQLAHTVRAMQEVFPELNVTGWTVVLSPGGNPHEPVIDQHRRSPATASAIKVVNAAGLGRGLKEFLSSGPAPNTVNVPVLARLLRGMH
ncbi:J domain-containing protein [Pseudarthrobacter sp. J64]|uniref:J domain-containing protein n=1 Tax=Pseudarthrobacter sp. J64 TaxID=3116485 RepID=UPI002E812A2A|nr:J domain-containing protein [Pseudarthrobacter sp. J64]MEE2568274.1 J domain-containing protein [Pseudarthrobacter sp. J64]